MKEPGTHRVLPERQHEGFCVKEEESLTQKPGSPGAGRTIVLSVGQGRQTGTLEENIKKLV